MSTNSKPLDVLEREAQVQRERINYQVGEIRRDIEQRLDLRRLAEERIHARPGAVYGGTAAIAALAGYLFARLLKA